MGQKLLLVIFTLLFTGAIKFMYPNAVMSQSCPGSVSISAYYCNPDPDSETQQCGDVIYGGFTTTRTCTWNGSSCVSQTGYCSSNDTCEKLNGKCYCTESPIDCNNPPSGEGGGGCTTTTPSVTSIQWGVPNANKVTINFNGGSGGQRNDIAFGSNKLNVTAKCLSSTAGCTTYTNVTSPLVVNSSLFSNGTVYYFKVWNIAGSCTKSSAIKQDISSCEISPNTIPTGSTPFNVGDPSKTLTSEVVSKYVYPTSPTAVKVTFSSGDSDVADVNPSSVTNSNSYQTQVSPVGAGSTVIRSSVYLDDVLACTAGDPTEVTVSDPSTPSCTLVLTPVTPSRNEGATPVTFTATVNVTPASATVNSVNFTSSNTNAATFSQPTYGSSPYYRDADIAASVSSDQTTTITASATVNGVSNLCFDESTLTVTNVTVSGSPWWKTVNGDITAKQDISSDVPSGSYLIEDGDTELPGLAVYGTTLNVGSGSTSTKDWNANTSVTSPRVFNYDYFMDQVPSDVVFNSIDKLQTGAGSTKSYGYEWYNVTGDLTIDYLVNLASRKVVLFVSGDLNLNNEVWLADGLGFFATFVNGSINIAGSITRVNIPTFEGIYLTDETFSTGVGTSKLWLRGSVIAHQGFNLQRDLADDANPSEIFEYGPDLIVRFPSVLAYKRSKWVEVNP